MNAIRANQVITIGDYVDSTYKISLTYEKLKDKLLDAYNSGKVIIEENTKDIEVFIYNPVYTKDDINENEYLRFITACNTNNMLDGIIHEAECFKFLIDDEKFVIKKPNNYEYRLLNDKDLSDEFKAWIILNNFEFLGR